MASIQEMLFNLLHGGGNIGGNPLTPGVVTPAKPSILMTGNRPQAPGAPGAPTDIRPEAAGGPRLPADAAAPVKAASDKPGLGGTLSRYGSAASAGMSSVKSESPWAAFGEALFGAIKGRADQKAAAESAAFERDWKLDDRSYDRGRDSVRDSQWATTEGRQSRQDALAASQWSIENERAARKAEFDNLKTAADIEASRFGKAMTPNEIEDSIHNAIVDGRLRDDDPEGIQVYRSTLESYGTRPRVRGGSEAQGNVIDLGKKEAAPPAPTIAPKGGTSIYDPTPIGAQGGRGAPKAAPGPKPKGSGTVADPYVFEKGSPAWNAIKPGEIFIDPDTKQPRRKLAPAPEPVL
jgi:hypothetical protein